LEIISSHTYTVYAIGSLAFLMLVQLLIADFVGIRAKHIPGSIIPSDHSNFLFRASRVVANTNESIAIYILATIFCVLSNASPEATAFTAWAFVFARLCYAVCYYSDLRIMRSVIFGLSLLTIVAQLVIGLWEWF